VRARSVAEGVHHAAFPRGFWGPVDFSALRVGSICLKPPEFLPIGWPQMDTDGHDMIRLVFATDCSFLRLLRYRGDGQLAGGEGRPGGVFELYGPAKVELAVTMIDL
jgi:hypothetical protein